MRNLLSNKIISVDQGVTKETETMNHTMTGGTIKTETIRREEGQGLRGEIIDIIIAGMNREITNQSMKRTGGRIHLIIGLIEMVTINQGSSILEKTKIVTTTPTNITRADLKIKNTRQVDTKGGPNLLASNITVNRKLSLEKAGTLLKLKNSQGLSQDQVHLFPTDRKKHRSKVIWDPTIRKIKTTKTTRIRMLGTFNTTWVK
jgi:hypothetical protein